MDITTDGFGFMLCFGKIVAVVISFTIFYVNRFWYNNLLRWFSVGTFYIYSSSKVIHKLKFSSLSVFIYDNYAKLSEIFFFIIRCSIVVFMWRITCQDDNSCDMNRYLVDYDPILPLWQIIIIVGIQVCLIMYVCIMVMHK